MRIDSFSSFARQIPEFNNKAEVFKVPEFAELPKVKDVYVDNFRSRMVSSVNDVELSANPKAQNFEQTLLKAFDMMNEKQVKVDTLNEQLIVDPESVDPHDVTLAMAEAGLSLKIAQTVIDKTIKSWNDITTSR